MRIIKSVLFGSTLFFMLSWAVGRPLESSILMIEALIMAAFLIAKAYGTAQLLRSHQKHKGWWPTKLAAVWVASATLVGMGVFYLMLKITHPIHLAGSPTLHLVWLGVVYATIRGYGMYRYGLLQPSGKFGILKDTTRILAGTAVGTLLVYLSDTVCESSLVTTPVLAVDMAMTLMSVTLVRSRLWQTAKKSPQPSTNGAGSLSDLRMLLVGAGPETEFYLSYLETVTGTRPPVVGVLDTSSDAPRAQTISGVRVLGSFAHLRAIVEAQRLDHVVYFAWSVSPEQESEMKAICERNGAKMSAFPNLLSFSNGHEGAGDA